MEFVIRVDFGQILGIYAGLFLFGLAFNALTDWLERTGYLEGFTSLVVAAGVAVTIAPFALVSWQIALAIVGGFAASGTPMIVGSFIRYVARRARARREIARLRNGDITSGLAE